MFIYFYPSCFKLLENRNVDLYLLRVSSFHRHYSMFACNTYLFVSDEVHRFTLQYTMYRFTGTRVQHVTTENRIINDGRKVEKKSILLENRNKFYPNFTNFLIFTLFTKKLIRTLEYQNQF